jgi:hypothetical protein
MRSRPAHVAGGVKPPIGQRLALRIRASTQPGSGRGRKSQPAALREPPPHAADAGNRGVVERMACAQSCDHAEHVLPLREGILGLAPQARPRVRARPAPERRPSECATGALMYLERSRAGARHTALSTPDRSQRDNEIAAAVGTQEADRVVTFTEKHLDAVSELSLTCPAPRAVEADRTQRTLHRDPTSLVHRGQTRHAESVAGHSAHVCAEVRRIRSSFQMTLAPSATWTPRRSSTEQRRQVARAASANWP